MQFEVSAVIPAKPETIYKAWLDSKEHTAMTGGEATASAEVDGEFTAWDNYISGRNVELEAGKRIVQSWRTTQFTEEEADSQIELFFEDHEEGCHLRLLHTKLPAHGEQYRTGWVNHYFNPMKAYFGE